MARAHLTWEMLWTAGLTPFLVLPYRWLWIPGALAAMLLLTLAPSRERLLRLGVGTAAVVVLRTALDPWWWAPWLVAHAMAAAIGGLIGGTSSGRVAAPAAAIVAGLLLWDFTPSRKEAPAIAASSVVVCVGDSLTSGLNGGGYPASLEGILGCRVVNAGAPNDRAADVARRFHRDVIVHRPDAVVIMIGGNDCVEGTRRADFRRGLDAIVSRSGGSVVLVEVPCGIVWNPYAGVTREVARQHGARLVPETRLRLWLLRELVARRFISEPLTLDGVHTSEAGARRISAWLAPHVLDSMAGAGHAR